MRAKGTSKRCALPLRLAEPALAERAVWVAGGDEHDSGPWGGDTEDTPLRCRRHEGLPSSTSCSKPEERQGAHHQQQR